MTDYPSTITLDITPPDPTKHLQIVRFKGDLDKAGLESIKKLIDQTVDSFQEKYLIFDFGKLRFINSEGIGMLLTVHYRLVKKNGALIIVQPPNNVKDVLDVIGLLKIITAYSSWADFEAVSEKA